MKTINSIFNRTAFLKENAINQIATMINLL